MTTAARYLNNATDTPRETNTISAAENADGLPKSKRLLFTANGVAARFKKSVRILPELIIIYATVDAIRTLLTSLNQIHRIKL